MYIFGQISTFYFELYLDNTCKEMSASCSKNFRTLDQYKHDPAIPEKGVLERKDKLISCLQTTVTM